MEDRRDCRSATTSRGAGGRSEVIPIVGEFFAQGSFQGGSHPLERVLAQLLGQGVGQVALESGQTDAIDLLFEFGNPGHSLPESRVRRVQPISISGDGANRMTLPGIPPIK